MNTLPKRISVTRGSVVATAHTPGGVRAAVRLRPGAVDLVEFRLDCLAGHDRMIAEALAEMRIPVLLTARHPAEGGAGSWNDKEREAMIRQFLPTAAAIDVELRAVKQRRELLKEAARAGILRIVSFHDFKSTPSLVRLRRIAGSAIRAGADVVKIAATLRGPNDLAALLSLLSGKSRAGMALMGMGPLGKVSRLTLGAAGSCLNYGFLDKPQVEGQWPALELAERLREIAP